MPKFVTCAPCRIRSRTRYSSEELDAHTPPVRIAAASAFLRAFLKGYAMSPENRCVRPQDGCPGRGTSSTRGWHWAHRSSPRCKYPPAAYSCREVKLGVPLEGLLIRLEHLHRYGPCFSTQRGDAELPVHAMTQAVPTTRRRCTPRARAQHGGVVPTPPGAELHHRAALRRTDNAVRLGGDQALMVEGDQKAASR